MFEKIEEISRKYEQICNKLMQPDIVSDHKLYTSLIQEQNSIKPLVEAYIEYRKCEDEIETAKQLLNEEDDSDFVNQLNEEIKSNKKRLGELEKEINLLLIPCDPNDCRNVIVEIRAGAGGEEAALFAADLYRMYSMYSSSNGFKIETITSNETGLGGYKEITFLVKGNGAFSKYKFESGVHRVQRVPKTESQGRIQTSTVTVAVLPEVEDINISINPDDLQIETCKSSGAGGQHINKTESAVRVIHKPTGIVIECQQERSQLQNKEKAINMLKTKLYTIKKEAQESEIASNRKLQVGTGDRSEKIRTYNFPQSRVTDHRIGLTLYSIESFMNGNIGPLIDALIAAESAEKMKKSEI